MTYDYDVIILGSGPAGFSCAMQASKFDKKAVLVEGNEHHLGGTWINRGTVPSKALGETARIIQRFQRQFNEDQTIKPHQKYKMADLLSYRKQILDSKNDKVRNDIEKNEVDIQPGRGRIVGEHEVEVTRENGEKNTITGSHILIATGSSAIPPTHITVEGATLLDYSSVLDLTHIPHRLVVIGSGVNALEFGTTFAALGTRVTMLCEKDDFLPFLDHEIKEQLDAVLQQFDIDLVISADQVEILENTLRNRTMIKYRVRNSKEPERTHVVETEHVLYLGPKAPNTGNLGLEHVGLDVDEEGYLDVGDDFQTKVPHIYAAGDVIGFPSLAASSFAQGRLAACSMFGAKTTVQSPDIPFGIYSIPELSHIGLTEQEARNLGMDVTVGRAYYKNITQGDITNQQNGLLKLVFETKSLKIVGIHIIGERASDLIHFGQAVMQLGGDIRFFVDHVMNYPTFSEAYKIAAFNGINRVHKAGVKYKKILKGSKKEGQE
ncbi:MAG: Si-specific NAD(P)(+) transhydrogenase [Bacteroidota bacterium]